MSSQKVTLNLIVLSQRGVPLFVLESASQDRGIFTEQALSHVQDRTHTLPDTKLVDGPSLSELVNRPPEHAGGQTLGELINKE